MIHELTSDWWSWVLPIQGRGVGVEAIIERKERDEIEFKLRRRERLL